MHWKIGVGCDGAGLARLGIEQAFLGSKHTVEITGVELDPNKHYLGTFVGKGKTRLADIRDIDWTQFDIVWMSPPCQWWSSARTQGDPKSEYAEANLLQWALSLPNKVLWVENIQNQTAAFNKWGSVYNAAQFTPTPLQNRNRIVGGRFPEPFTYRRYKQTFNGVCPTIVASEYKGCASDKRRASRYYGRKLTIEECAYHQGFTIPIQWYAKPDWKPEWSDKTLSKWKVQLYEAIGNGVPVYMAYQFARAVEALDTLSSPKIKQHGTLETYVTQKERLEELIASTSNGNYSYAQLTWLGEPD